MKYHVEFEVNAPGKASQSQAREWIRFMCGYSAALSPKNPLKKASFDPVFGSMKIQSVETRETRRAVMLAAWQYRRTGLTMSEGMKKAWADCKAVKARAAANPNVLFFQDYVNKEVIEYGKAENF
jgi:hypothetical protein